MFVAHPYPRRGAVWLNLIIALLILTLVVSAIVPAVMATRKRSTDAECLFHLGQMAQAHRRLPPETQESMVWIRRFLIEAGLPESTYRCPAAWEIGDWGSLTESWRCDATIPEGKLQMVSSYTLNAWVLPADANNERGGAGFFINPASPAARVPVFGDGTWIDAYPLESDPTPPELISGHRHRQGREYGARENMLARFTIARHQHTINVGFLDGHAEPVKLNDLKRLPWHEGWQPRDWMPALPVE